MEYIFGIKGAKEVLKTKGTVHSELTGYHSIEQKYPDQTISDYFRIIRKLDSQVDVEGNCYDWYEIDHHYRITDKTGPIIEKAAEDVASIETALCEQDEAIDARVTSIEDAICELDAAINNTEETQTDE